MRFDPPYESMERFTSPARPARSLFIVAAVLALVWIGFWGPPWLLLGLGVNRDWLAAFAMGATPAMLFLSLSSFALPIAALAYGLRRFHKRGLASLLGRHPDAPDPFLKTLRNTGLLLVVLTLSGGLATEFIVEIRPLPVWLLILPFALLATLIQVSAEELLFRGYLQQQLGALSARPIVWMVVPSILFALPHALNTVTPADALFYVGWTFFFGIAAADLTARSGTLGPALAMHLSNNLIQFVLFGYKDGPMSGFALILYEWDGAPLTWMQPDYPLASAIFLVISFLTLFLLWLSARLAIRR